MIDLNTGIIKIEDIIISPDISLADFYKYPKEQVNILDLGHGNGIVRILNRVHSNGIDAGVKIEIDENPSARRVIITPALQHPGSISVLDASKLWMRGFAIGEYTENCDRINGYYEWGHFSAKYRKDPHYGTIGGNIIIRYRK